MMCDWVWLLLTLCSLLMIVQSLPTNLAEDTKKTEQTMRPKCNLYYMILYYIIWILSCLYWDVKPVKRYPVLTVQLNGHRKCWCSATNRTINQRTILARPIRPPRKRVSFSHRKSPSILIYHNSLSRSKEL